MKITIVFDSIQVSTRQVLDNGFLLCKGRVSKPGIYPYTPASIGIESNKPVLKFYRPPTAVFDSKSMESFRRKPVTDGHNGFVFARNSGNIMKGLCEDVYKDTDKETQKEYVGVQLLLTEDGIIKDIDEDKKELSAGHRCRFVLQEGTTPEGEAYDGIQDMIEVNHIAVVEKGRAGHDCIIFDSDDIHDDKHQTNTKTQKGALTMVKVAIKGKLYEVSDEAVGAIEELKNENTTNEKKAKEKDEAVVTIESLKKQLDALQAKVDALTGEKKSLEEKLTPDALDKAVEARLAVIGKAKVLVPAYDAKGKDIPTIKREIVKTMCVDIDDITKKSEAYIDGRFDSLTVKSSAIDEAIKSSFTKTGTEDEDIVEKAKQKKLKDDREAWKTKK